jgi:hypothetical protein
MVARVVAVCMVEAPRMSDIAPVSGITGDRLDTVSTPGERPAPLPPWPAGRPSDRVELSDRARLLSKLASLPPVRQDLIDTARAAIEAGSYDGEEVLNQAIEGMLQDLRDM